jgi:flagellum-specific peptidoglycan hydrolase FlgJ
MKSIQRFSMTICALFLLIIGVGMNPALATTVEPVHLIVDGKDITAISNPVIENDRLLVPIRYVSEAIGAEVSWDAEKRSVRVERDGRDFQLWIDNRLVSYLDGAQVQLCDVSPKIINDHTYIPLRLMSNALSVGIEWDGDTRTATVDSGAQSAIEAFYDTKMISLREGERITGSTQIGLAIPANMRDRVAETQLILLETDSAKGFVVARETNAVDVITYKPKVEDRGAKILALAFYDQERNFIGGHALPVTIDVKPLVELQGVDGNGSIASITMGQKMNFLPEYVNYELTNLDTGKIHTISERDPEGTYKWVPTFEQNGNYRIKVIGVDGNGEAYESAGVSVRFEVDRKLALKGVSAGKTVTKPITIYASRNFDVTETSYYVRDVRSGKSELIKSVPYGEIDWFPGPNESGEKELYVKVKDVGGTVHTSDPVRVEVDGSPVVILYGLGPNEVITKWTELSIESNVVLDEVRYILVNRETGAKKTLHTTSNQAETYRYNAQDSDAGLVRVYAEASYKGSKLTSENRNFKIYRDSTYGPKAIVEKSEFLGFASTMAVNSFEKTGMSAALQTAQAILETASGQRLPVDRYTGKFSYNLFGIKGSANNGSVTSSTWEVYNGMTYHVDADFRAYNNVTEAWADHKRILLELSRYQQYRDVMYDYTQSAWAIRRAGYATDPKYPMKLINIVKRYDLKELDQVSIQ